VQVVVAAFVLRRTLVLTFGVEVPVFGFLYPAVILVGLFWGLWCGLLATALAAGMTAYWFLPPFGSPRVGRPSDAMVLAFFLGMGVFFSVLAERYRRVQTRRAALERAQALRQSEDRFAALVTATSDVVYRMSPDWSEMYQLTGRGFIADTHAPNVNWIQRYIPPEDQLQVNLAIGEALRTKSKFELEHRVVRVDGSLGWTSSRAIPLLDNNGRILEWFGAASDITQRKQAEEGLRLAASVFSHAAEGIMITDPDGAILDVNDAFTGITGYTRDEVIGQNPRILNSSRQDRSLYEEMWRSLREKEEWSGEVWNRHKDGQIYAVMQTTTSVRDTNGDVQRYVSLFCDITQLKLHEHQLEQMAYFDTLTGLPNRVLLGDRLRQAMLQTERHGQTLAVALLDLDNFKAVNDSHGHEAGDKVLADLAGRMKLVLREGDTLARLGGDEFVAVLPDLGDIEVLAPVLTRLVDAVSQPVQIANASVQVSASLGVTLYPQEEEQDGDQLLRQADQAMYQAKQMGRNRYEFFDFMQDRTASSRHESLNCIRQALAAREFVLYYQPKVNMRTGEVVGAEALIRWQHPERGLLPPSMFLPLIEDHPVAIEVGEWVIDSALAQMEAWQTSGFDLPVSVNLGSQQLQQDHFVDHLSELLARHPQIPPASLELEVLETSSLRDIDNVARTLDACCKVGVSFALDDFGTGYSSLSHLKRLPAQVLKIDRSFVRGMLDDAENLNIVEGVLGLASAFRRQVIAEGVETADHGLMLLEMGCELAQGYAIAHPMAACDLPDWSAAWGPDPRWAAAPSRARSSFVRKPVQSAGASESAAARSAFS
jgi:diguanylate cyclase (GGDEF)-like protein/PAS domain S-box-containing protein